MTQMTASDYRLNVFTGLHKDTFTAACPVDLSMALCAQLLLAAKDQVTSRCIDLGASISSLSRQDLLHLISQVDRGLALCNDVTARWDKGYLLSLRNLEVREAEAAHRQALFDSFQERIIYVGTDEVPRTHSLLGWLDDDFRFPVAVSRDCGHLNLICGAQGMGKTLFSTILCETSVHAQEPLTSSFLLPSGYCFFHLEEQDRLPQLLDSLKKNPVQKDLDLLMQRLGVGPTPASCSS